MSDPFKQLELDMDIAAAVKAERQRIYDLFLTTPWGDPDEEEESEADRAIKSDRFMLMTLVRDGVHSYKEHSFYGKFHQPEPELD